MFQYFRNLKNIVENVLIIKATKARSDSQAFTKALWFFMQMFSEVPKWFYGTQLIGWNIN